VLLKIEERDGQFAKQISISVSFINFDFIYYRQPHINGEMNIAFVKNMARLRCSVFNNRIIIE